MPWSSWGHISVHRRCCPSFWNPTLQSVDNLPFNRLLIPIYLLVNRFRQTCQSRTKTWGSNEFLRSHFLPFWHQWQALTLSRALYSKVVAYWKIFTCWSTWSHGTWCSVVCLAHFYPSNLRGTDRVCCWIRCWLNRASVRLLREQPLWLLQLHTAETSCSPCRSPRAVFNARGLYCFVCERAPGHTSRHHALNDKVAGAFASADKRQQKSQTDSRG